MLPTPKSTLERILKNLAHKVKGESLDSTPLAHTNTEKYLQEIVTSYTSGGGGGGGEIPTDIEERLEALEQVFSVNPNAITTKYVNFNTFRNDADLLVIDSSPYPWQVDYSYTPLVIKSTNYNVNSSQSRIDISFEVVAIAGELHLETLGGGENGYDRLQIQIFNSSNASVYSAYAQNNQLDWQLHNISIPTSGTYRLVLTYGKDGSGNVSPDMFYVQNIYIKGGKTT